MNAWSHTSQAWAAADVPTLALLFGLMVISAQLRLGGFYTAVSRALIAAAATPAALLARIMAAPNELVRDPQTGKAAGSRKVLQ